MLRRSIFLAMLAAAAVFVPAAGAVLPTLYVNYAMNCTFTISDDSGKAVSSIAPGTYEIQVHSPVDFASVGYASADPSDFTGCHGYAKFQLTGPGVSLYNTIGDGGEDTNTLGATFRAASTYTAVDVNQPTVAHLVFTTTATGSASSVASPSSSTSSQGTASAAPKVPFRGSLDAIVYANRKLTLTRNGKAVKSLKTGQYTFSVDDESAKAGFSVQVLRGKTQTVTTSGYVGSHDVTLSLKPGRWWFFTPGGLKTTFFVVS